MKKLDLNGTWRMRQYGSETWISAHVPGSVASDLLQAGLIEDPYYRDQQYEVFDILLHDYEYEREFIVDNRTLQEADRLELICEGLDTIAEIRLNGDLIAETRNMHRTFQIDISSSAVAGVNKLQILFRSPVEYVKRIQQERFLWAANDDFVVQGYPHLRKAHHMFGWDWGPKLPDSGIWRDIYIAAYQEARIQEVYVTQDHTISGSVGLDVMVQTEHFKQKCLELRAMLYDPNGVIVAEEIMSASATKHMLLKVNEPQLWWPNGLGSQPLYDLIIQLTNDGVLVDEYRCRIGLRTLTVKREPDLWGESFEFTVNGVSIFTMGANYIPEDNLRYRLNRHRTEQLIRDCVHANFNCIRVWGGGFYPDDDFFDLCDEYGLIVWQDHLFACAEYEMTAEFTEEIKAEIADNVKRIRHHASLGLWCGNNEMEWAWAEWDFPKREQLRTDYIKQFEIIIPEVTKQHDPKTFYWKASPSSGGGFNQPNASDRGDVHYWEVWHGGKSFTEYRNHFFRFCSEFGFQSFPSLKTIASFTEPGDLNIFSTVMESHQKNAGGNGKILYGISENFLYPKDLDSLLYVSQLLQAEAIRYGVEHWRRHRGRCMGSIYWQLNDCWPVASWSSIDYYGRWKALHYVAKRFYAPVMLTAEETGSQVKLCVTNDTLQQIVGSIVWRLRDSGSKILLEDTIDAVQVEGMSAQWCTELDFAEQLRDGKNDKYVEFEFLVNDEVVSNGLVLFVKPKHFKLAADPNVFADMVEDEDCFVVTVQSKALALFVELDFEKRDVRFSDNFFHVSAASPKRVILLKSEISSTATVEDLRKELRIRSLSDTFLR